MHACRGCWCTIGACMYAYLLFFQPLVTNLPISNFKCSGTLPHTTIDTFIHHHVDLSKARQHLPVLSRRGGETRRPHSPACIPTPSVPSLASRHAGSAGLVGGAGGRGDRGGQVQEYPEAGLRAPGEDRWDAHMGIAIGDGTFSPRYRLRPDKFFKVLDILGSALFDADSRE